MAFSGLVDMLVFSHRLDLMILGVFSNFNGSMILSFTSLLNLQIKIKSKFEEILCSANDKLISRHVLDNMLKYLHINLSTRSSN